VTYAEVFDGATVDPEAIVKFVLAEGKGTLTQNTDDVYYRHETRHDNGQLVDFSERRKVDEKFEMKNPCFHEHYKIVLRTMQRGEVAYVRFPRLYHKGAYHNSQHYINKTPEEKANIGDYIYVRFQVNKIKRNPVCHNSETFEGIMDYYQRIRDVARELMEESEYVNAQDLYKRILPNFKNMPRTMRESLTEEQKGQRMDALHILLLNIGLCHMKRNNPREAIKSCKEAIEAKQDNPKAFYRLGVAQKDNGELEPAKESLLQALKLAPGDLTIRNEYTFHPFIIYPIIMFYKSLLGLMDVKHKEWYQKMNGFLHSEKMVEIEKRDQEEQLLKEKLLKKEFAWGTITLTSRNE
jgi:tetratricopeptide (TPR) repeat protein